MLKGFVLFAFIVSSSSIYAKSAISDQAEHIFGRYCLHAEPILEAIGLYEYFKTDLNSLYDSSTVSGEQREIEDTQKKLIKDTASWQQPHIDKKSIRLLFPSACGALNAFYNSH